MIKDHTTESAKFFETNKLKPRQLQPVNVHTLFCKGCGIAPAPQEGRDCPTCYSIASHVWNAREPLPIKIHIAIALALAVFIAGMVIALRI